MTSLHLYNNAGRPRVPCWSCGEPSDGWFPDGSPSWAHSHEVPKPYYIDDLVTIYHGDALAIAPRMTADVLVMDPPFDRWADAKAAPTQTVIAFTSWQHRDAVHALYGKPRAEIIWAFADGRWVSHELPRITHETILVFGSTGSAYVGKQTDGVPVRKGTGSIGRDKTGPRTYTPHERKSLDSVQFFPRNVSGPLGVWGKPLPLMTRLLEWVGGETVLDPYAGGGTTLVAAKSLGRKSVGIEIDERSCEMAANRCRQEVLGLGVGS